MQRLLNRVANLNKRALVARYGTLHQDQTALGIGTDDFQILHGNAGRAIMSGHLLSFKDLSRILALPGRAMGTVGNGDPVGRP